MPWCEKHGVVVVGYSPFSHGGFPGPRSERGRLLAEIAAAHHATPRQIALSFLVRRPSLFAIPKSSSAAHVEENAGAAEIHLSKSDLARIDQVFPLGHRPR